MAKRARGGGQVPFRAALARAAAALGRPLADTALAGMETHHRLLLQWGRRMNLTGLSDTDAILARHFLEPISVADLLGDEGTLVDLGSGNGFPALPLKMMHPGLDLVMVEASERKSAFLRAVLIEAGVRGARVVTRHLRRRDDLGDLLPARFLTLRAVKSRELLAGRGPILEPGGRALFFVSPDEAASLGRDPIPGLRLADVRPLSSGPKAVAAILTAA